MNFEIVVRQVEEGKVIKESLIKKIQVSEPKIFILPFSFDYISISKNLQQSQPKFKVGHKLKDAVNKK